MADFRPEFGNQTHIRIYALFRELSSLLSLLEGTSTTAKPAKPTANITRTRDKRVNDITREILYLLNK